MCIEEMAKMISETEEAVEFALKNIKLPAEIHYTKEAGIDGAVSIKLRGNGATLTSAACEILESLVEKVFEADGIPPKELVKFICNMVLMEMELKEEK